MEKGPVSIDMFKSRTVLDLISWYLIKYKQKLYTSYLVYKYGLNMIISEGRYRNTHGHILSEINKLALLNQKST